MIVAGMRPVWVLLDETPHEDWDGLSLIGLFTSRQAAFAYLQRYIVGEETPVYWRRVRGSRDFWEGSLSLEESKVFLCVRPAVRA